MATGHRQMAKGEVNMKVIVSGLAIEYRDEGKGPILLMLHGWKDDLRTFDPLIKELSKAYRIIRVDLPGFGGSEMPPSPWCVEDYARFVAAFLEKVGMSTYVLIGHSLGGRIVVKGVSERILYPQKMVLIASAGVAHRRTLRNIAFASMAKIGRFVLAPFPGSLYERAREALHASAGSDYASAGAMSETFLNIIREDLSAAASKITTPTLLIWGESDTATPLSEGKKFKKLISQSILTAIPRAGHFVHRERPKEVAQAIAQFV